MIIINYFFDKTAMFDKASCSSSVEYTNDTKRLIVLPNNLVVNTKAAGHLERSSSCDQAEFPPVYTADDGNNTKR